MVAAPAPAHDLPRTFHRRPGRYRAEHSCRPRPRAGTRPCRSGHHRSRGGVHPGCPWGTMTRRGRTAQHWGPRGVIFPGDHRCESGRLRRRSAATARWPYRAGRAQGRDTATRRAPRPLRRRRRRSRSTDMARSNPSDTTAVSTSAEIIRNSANSSTRSIAGFRTSSERREPDRCRRGGAQERSGEPHRGAVTGRVGRRQRAGPPRCDQRQQVSTNMREDSHHAQCGTRRRPSSSAPCGGHTAGPVPRPQRKGIVTLTPPRRRQRGVAPSASVRIGRRRPGAAARRGMTSLECWISSRSESALSVSCSAYGSGRRRRSCGGVGRSTLEGRHTGWRGSGAHLSMPETAVPLPHGFEVVPLIDAELTVAESPRMARR